MSKNFFVASDHAGLPLKEFLIKNFKEISWEDLGTNSDNSVDYPDFAKKLCDKLINNPKDTFGLLICGTGQGMAMTANKFSHIRAALCWNKDVTQLSREHNNANVLCLGARTLDFEVAKNLLSTFIQTDFSGGRHSPRVDKINKED